MASYSCSFCGKKIVEGTGFTLFKKDGRAVHYCSRKCERNAALGRKPFKLKWTEKYGLK